MRSIGVALGESRPSEEGVRGKTPALRVDGGVIVRSQLVRREYSWKCWRKCDRSPTQP